MVINTRGGYVFTSSFCVFCFSITTQIRWLYFYQKYNFGIDQINRLDTRNPKYTRYPKSGYFLLLIMGQKMIMMSYIPRLLEIDLFNV